MPEHELYRPILEWVMSAFRQRFSWRANSNFVAMDVADLDWSPSAGRWMHPDLAFVHVHRRTFDPTPCLDLHTFEVKPDGADLLQGLHQTLAHGRIADFVYLIAPSNGNWSEAVLSQARKFGVGLVSFDQAEVLRSYLVLNDPVRCTPDPDLRDDFLKEALTQTGNMADVLRWLGLGG